MTMIKIWVPLLMSVTIGYAFDNPKLFSVQDDLDLTITSRQPQSKPLSIVPPQKSKQLAEVNSPPLTEVERPYRTPQTLSHPPAEKALSLSRPDSTETKSDLSTVDVSDLKWTRPSIERHIQSLKKPKTRVSHRPIKQPRINRSLAYAPPPPKRAPATSSDHEIRVSLHLEQTPIDSALSILSHMAQKELIMPQPMKGRVTAIVKKLPWPKALDLILKSSPYTWTLDQNILVIHTPETPVEEKKQLEHHEFSLTYLTAKQAETIVRPFLSQHGKVSAHTSRSMLIVAEIPEVLETITRILEAADLPEQKIRIQTIWAELSPEAAQELGIASSHGHFQVTYSHQALLAKLKEFETQGLAAILSTPQIITLNHKLAHLTQTDLYKKHRAKLIHSISVAFKPRVISTELVELQVNLSHSNPTQGRKKPDHSQNTQTSLLLKRSDTVAMGGLSPLHTTKRFGEHRLIAFISADVL